MSRQLKFRAWVYHLNRMCEVASMHFDTQLNVRVKISLGLEEQMFVDSDYPDCVLMQSTGLKDCNNILIHEGDILHFTVFNAWGNDTQYTGVVRFGSGGWEIWHKEQYEFYGDDGAFDLFWVRQQDDEIEVLGNIHENQEILEVRR